jgi:UDP-N-acetylglucosamine 4,6-dehydratase/5-epimerase
MQRYFKNKTLLITGGTGSFGNAILDRFLGLDIAEIRVLSRDEKKQDDMRKKYSNDKLNFYIGDVRDPQSLMPAMKGVDYLFHAAALKQVPSCEFYPLEAVKTNILGTENILEAAIVNKVKRVVCLSTDKAVYPINAMGMSKGLMEKVILAKARISSETIICTTRYGNVMASRGSVIPLFINQIKSGEDITITDPDMTRFMMTLEDAVDLVLHAFKNGQAGDLYVQKAPAASIDLLVDVIKELFKVPNHPTKIIGTRHGEKLYEVLMSREETSVSEDQGRYYRLMPDLRGLNYSKYIDLGVRDITLSQEYNSHNTHRLDKPELKKLLKKLRIFSKM